MYLIEGFLVGLLGSLHCVGMCGPIALALPLGNKSIGSKIAGGLLYNIGRTITYGSLGFIFGLLGAGIRISGFQQWVSIAMGGFMILSVFLPRLFKQANFLNRISSPVIKPLKNRIAAGMKERSFFTLFAIGILNGLLPCGLVYIAVSGAITSNTILSGVGYMVLFGLGTLPMMFFIVYLGNIIRSSWLLSIRRLIPVFIVVLGILFILRGLNLGIPYISPNLTTKSCCQTHCH